MLVSKKEKKQKSEGVEVGRRVRQGEQRKTRGAGGGGEQVKEGGREGWRETSPLLSLRWDFYGWVSLVRATKHIKSHFQFVAGS